MGDAYEVTNAGISGSSVVAWDPDVVGCPLFCPQTPDLTLYESVTQEHIEGSIVSILLGTNDAAGFFLESRTPPDVYRSLLQKLVDRAIADGAAAVILMSPPPWPEGRFPNPLLGEYGQEIEDLCRARAVVSCGPDLFELLDEFQDFTGMDVHPNVSGHERIAQALRLEILAVPEPSTFAGLAIGLVMIAIDRRGLRSLR